MTTSKKFTVNYYIFGITIDQFKNRNNIKIQMINLR